jgi:hypothetical protein
MIQNLGCRFNAGPRLAARALPVQDSAGITALATLITGQLLQDFLQSADHDLQLRILFWPLHTFQLNPFLQTTQRRAFA